jgi:hypothetical protein
MLDKILSILAAYGVDVTSSEALVQFILSRTIEKTLNYCCLTKIPAKLENYIVEMCVAMYVQSQAAMKAGQGIAAGTGAVTSIKQGDEQTNFDSGSAANAVLKTYMDQVFSESQKELNKFRKFASGPGWG